MQAGSEHHCYTRLAYLNLLHHHLKSTAILPLILPATLNDYRQFVPIYALRLPTHGCATAVTMPEILKMYIGNSGRSGATGRVDTLTNLLCKFAPPATN